MKTHPGNYLALAFAALALNLSVIQSAQAATWITNGPMTTARDSPTAILLPNGKVLVTGGMGQIGYRFQALSSAELYDPATGTWTNTGALSHGRYGHTATLLPGGKVLVAGGDSVGNSSELYDPATGTWTTTGSLNTARYNHTATLLPDGKVLVAGGDSVGNSSELYDPATGTWTATGALNTARFGHTATLLPNGQVLVAGGTPDGRNPLSSTELYNPATKIWTATTSPLNTARQYHTATLLPNGQVLVAGGLDNNFTNSVELYDPAAGKWTTTNFLTVARSDHTATLLSSGQLLIAGGDGITGYLASMELYDPASGTWTNSGALLTAPEAHTATLLTNGTVLVVSGLDGGNFAQLYDPATGTNTLTGSLNTGRYFHTATLLPSGQVLVAGGMEGYYPYPPLSSVEIYDPANGTWTVTNSLTAARNGHTATLLPNGKVLVAGGYNTNSGALSSAELFNPATGTWTNTGSMTNARVGHTAILLSNGKVLVAGGGGAELYDPATETWTVTGAMTTNRARHTATLLPNGRVLVAGGLNVSTYLTSSELYDPVMGIWSATGSMTNERAYHKATLLPSGKVLVMGGIGISTRPGLNILASAEIYDPDTGKWILAGAMTTNRAYHTATLLPNGRVLVAGGVNMGVINNINYLFSTELYDVGLGFSNSWQPRITSLTSPLNLGGNLVVTGSQFRGISGGSGGNSQDSSADYPLVQLRSIESGQTVFLLTTNWSTNSFTSLPVWNFPPGYALATVFVNGIQSTSSVVNISVPVPTVATLASPQKLTNGFQFAFTNSVGALFGVLATTNLSLPLTNWTALGGVTEISPGQFQFTDPQAMNNLQRFYRAYSP